MASLNETTKKAKKYVIYFIIIAVLITIVSKTYKYIKEDIGPSDPTSSPYQYIDKVFGTIEYPKIPTLILAEGSKPSFTIAGNFEKSPNSVNVYKRIVPRETLGAVSQAEQIASELGFKQSYDQENQLLTWTLDGKVFRYNTLTREADYQYKGYNIVQIRKDRPSFIDIKKIDELIKSEATKLAQVRGLQFEYLLRYFADVNGQYKTTNSAETSNYIRLDIFQKIEGVSLKTNLSEDQKKKVQPVQSEVHLDDPLQGSVDITIFNRDYEEAKSNPEYYLEMIKEFHENVSVASTQKATYPLKTKEQAWEDIKDGEGSLRLLVRQGDDPLAKYVPVSVIRFTANPDLVKLGYYITKAYSEYFYPIYIFQGTADLSDGRTADFIFYVNAIDSSK